MQKEIENNNKSCDSRDSNLSESQFWFEREDGKRYYAKQVGDSIIILNRHTYKQKMRFSVDKLEEDILEGEVTDFGIE